jgi:hypothetical protein
MAALMCLGFPIPPDAAIDLVSGALAAVEGTAMVGLHCCGDGDLAAILATGPAVLSVPVRAELVRFAGYLASFLDAGGTIAWGVVPTEGPVGTEADRYWRELAGLWCELAAAGCDIARLRNQALLTPACGLAMHTADGAAHVAALVELVATKVQHQAVATRLSLGA